MPNEVHYLPETLRRFVAGDLDDATTDRLRHHLKGGCPSCRRRLADALGRTRSHDAERYSEAFSKAHHLLNARCLELAGERLAAPEQALRLSEINLDQLKIRLAHQPQFRTWGLCEYLLAQTEAPAHGRNLEQCIQEARTAVLVSEYLDADRYGSARLQDLRAEAYGRLGNAHRMAAEFSAARRCFSTARQLLSEGTGDQRGSLSLSCLEISLETGQGRWDQAWEQVTETLARCPQDSDPEILHRLLIQRGVSRVMVDPADAVAAYTDALSKPLTDPYLRVVAQRGLLFGLIRAHRLTEASKLYEQIDRHPAHARVKVFDPWLAGMLHLRQDRPSDAVNLIREAIRQGQLGIAAPPRLVLLHLDLLAALTGAGRSSEARRVASEMAWRLTAWSRAENLHRAWARVQRRLAEGLFDSDFQERAVRFFSRIWGTPSLRLEG